MSRLVRFLKRKLDSLFFLFKSPSSIKVEVLNPSRIFINSSSRVGYFGRLFVNSPKDGGGIFFNNQVWTGRNVQMQTFGEQRVVLGRKATVQDLCKIGGDVKIGAYTTIASNMTAVSTTHQFLLEPEMLIKQQDELLPIKSYPIEIGEDVWIGANVLVKEGVRIGRGAVIGANSVVNKDVDPYSVWVGVPAKRLKDRLEYQPPGELNFQNKKHKIYFDMGFDHENEFSEGMKIIESTARLSLAPNQDHYKLKVFSKGESDLNVSWGSIHQDYKLAAGVNELEVTHKDLSDASPLKLNIGPKGVKLGLYLQSLS